MRARRPPPPSYLPGACCAAARTAAASGPDALLETLLESLLETLRRGGERLRALPPDRRLEAWRRAVTRLLDPSSTARRELDAPLAGAVRLSAPGLQAGLLAIASGMLGGSADELFRSASGRPPASHGDPALVVLASNLPGLALQTVLPALARGRPLIIKSSALEPYFAPALLRELAVAEPELAEAFAAITWAHGAPIESALLERCDPVLAYGGNAALDALRPRAAGRFVEYGPKISLGIVGAPASDEQIELLARDVALFDQRGCLSIQAVLSLAPIGRVAAALARGLDRQAGLLPPGPPTPDESAAVRRELDLAGMRGCEVIATRAGSIVVEPERALLATSPGRRFVRLYPLASIESLSDRLTGLSGALQGAAVAGIAPGEVESRLAPLGLSRTAPAGRLQETDARWHNGGVDPLEVL
ncbi:MAG TPA: acyl-CoA reductase [Thermoanaerobaculia bacterium]|nr:acyl-CoA reductase [Thermoanaerobaculia bacterium]